VSLNRENASTNIQETPLDEKNYQSALRSGTMQFKDYPEGNAIHIERRSSNAKGSGFGTASMRHIVDTSFQRGFEGNIYSQTSWSSHVFHLYMGMMPQANRSTHLLSYCYGSIGLEKFGHFQNNSREVILDKRMFNSALNMALWLENNRSRSGVFLEMYDLLRSRGFEKPEHTADEMIANKEKILSLFNEEVPYITFTLVPQLISALRTNQQFPDTNSWGSIDMVLSEEGKARWKNAIDNKFEFRPFKNFEQLQPYMSENQKEQLKEVLQNRSQALTEAKRKQRILYSIFSLIEENKKLTIKQITESDAIKNEDFIIKTHVDAFQEKMNEEVQRIIQDENIIFTPGEQSSYNKNVELSSAQLTSSLASLREAHLKGVIDDSIATAIPIEVESVLNKARSVSLHFLQDDSLADRRSKVAHVCREHADACNLSLQTKVKELAGKHVIACTSAYLESMQSKISPHVKKMEEDLNGIYNSRLEQKDIERIQANLNFVKGEIDFHVSHPKVSEKTKEMFKILGNQCLAAINSLDTGKTYQEKFGALVEFKNAFYQKFNIFVKSDTATGSFFSKMKNKPSKIDLLQKCNVILKTDAALTEKYLSEIKSASAPSSSRNPQGQV